MIKKICVLPVVLTFVIASAQTNLPTGDKNVPAPAGNAPVYKPDAYNAGMPVNYVRTWEPQRPYTSEPDVIDAARFVNEVHKATQYIDGLGRPLQSVSWQMSPQKNDVVSPVVYDAFGREQYKFLPYTSPASN